MFLEVTWPTSGQDVLPGRSTPFGNWYHVVLGQVLRSLPAVGAPIPIGGFDGFPFSASQRSWESLLSRLTSGPCCSMRLWVGSPIKFLEVFPCLTMDSPINDVVSSFFFHMTFGVSSLARELFLAVSIVTGCSARVSLLSVGCMVSSVPGFYFCGVAGPPTPFASRIVGLPFLWVFQRHKETVLDRLARCDT